MAVSGLFKTAERSRSLSDEAFRAARDQLRLDLVELQQQARAAGFPIIVVLAGVQGSGIIDALNLLNSWMDPRWIHTHAFDEPTDEERERPLFWRYWRMLPAAGNIGLYLGGWYDQVLANRCKGASTKEFQDHLARIARFEDMLAANGALVVKFWLHLSERQQKRIVDFHKTDAVFGFRSSDNDWPQPAHYKKYLAAAGPTLRATHTDQTPWHVINGADDNHRRSSLLTVLRDAMANHGGMLRKKAKADAKIKRKEAKADKKLMKAPPRLGPLSNVNLKRTMTDQRYAKEFHRLQPRLYKAQKAARAAGISTVVVFEGWDAAGKGGAIRRLTYGMNARNYKVVPIAAPTDEERAHHYLWRFWREISRAGRMTLFDRSWYGRVLVEPIEHFITHETCERGYGEIKDFEAQLAAHGTIVLKFWLHLSPDEQLRRFKDRRDTPYKRWKLTDDDWRNRAKWPLYVNAVNAMVKRTSTKNAPWHLVPANDKKLARIMVLETAVKAMEAALAKHKRK